MIKQVAEEQRGMANMITTVYNLLVEHVTAKDIENQSESLPHLDLPFRGTHSNL